jgi:hypothetical protein
LHNEKPPSPAFWAVIPATVRYNKSIPPSAKLLYAEISALCNLKGHCWAGNAYFANLYKTTERSVINWINTLKNAGVIDVTFTYVPGKKEIKSRNIKLKEPGLPSPYEPPPLEPDPGLPESPASGSPETGAEAVPAPAPPEGETAAPEPHAPAEPEPALVPEGGAVKISSPRGENNFTTYGKNLQEVVKNSSQGGENFFRENIKSYYYNINKASAASPHPASGEGCSQAPPAAAEDTAPNAGDLKARLLAVSQELFFDPAFYPKASAYLASSGLPDAFLSWLCAFCLKKNPRSLAGLFYTLFFTEQAAVLFRRSAEIRAPPPPQNPAFCPVCGDSLPDGAGRCPSCGLDRFASAEDAERHKKFWLLPQDRKSAFSRESRRILDDSSLSFPEKLKAVAKLREQYGLP